ncbi:lipocalin-like domain-containing protein [Georgfuchsia toluolica]|uniref:lipocalin-like domain-containing protein n=1 Tax=Georgfuchsia toluolica TaxID=424218 RepID=UPI001FE65A41|nr:lipocalin-like domain-containing protein [Georgfuchsia toluolica]
MLALTVLPNLRPAVAQALEFASVLPGRKLVFPADHGAHPDFRMEWWYVTGWLRLPDGSPLGFQSTFFRVRTGIGETSASAFAPRQLILAHAAIADPHLKRLRHDERAARIGFGRAGYDTDRTNVWVGDWHLEQHKDSYRATVRGEDFAYALDLVPSGPPMLNGLDGFSAKTADQRHSSYYYSRPQLRVDGTVTLDGRTSPVAGRAWLDHEWFSELLPQVAQGWDWLGVNLDDGSALMAFRLRNEQEATLWSAANYRRAGGGIQAFPPGAVAFEPMRRWRSPRTGVTYPVEWRIRIGARIFLLQALMDDQELDSRRSTGIIYWEGAVRLMEGGREIGHGYLELTGYGKKIQLGD